MSKALKLSFYLPYAVFRNPLTFTYTQTYPLPPPSTVVGLIQKMVRRFDIYDQWRRGKIRLSIKGDYKSTFTHFVRKIKGNLYFDHLILNVTSRDKKPERLISSQRTPIFEQELYSLDLVLHVKADDNALLEEIKNSFEKTKSIVSFGRAENVAFYKEEPKIIEVDEKPESSAQVTLSYNTYASPFHFRDEREQEKFLVLGFLEQNYEKNDRFYYSAFADVKRPASLKIDKFYKLLYIEKGQRIYIDKLGEEVEFIKIKNNYEPIFWLSYES